MESLEGVYEELDVHGAGAQRSDPKYGDPASSDYEYGRGPQGDVVRILNFVRVVRGFGDVEIGQNTENPPNTEGNITGFAPIGILGFGFVGLTIIFIKIKKALKKNR
jgi:hypothetical protein